MKTILVIDDDTMSLDIIVEHFEQSDYDLITFSDSSEAFQFLQNTTKKIDAVLLDVVMENVSGFEILKYIRINENRFGSIPVIMISAGTMDNGRRKAFELRATDYLLKPFDEKDLSKIIDDYLGSST